MFLGFAMLWVYSEGIEKPIYYTNLVSVMSIRSVDSCPVHGTVQVVVVVNYGTYFRNCFIL